MGRPAGSVRYRGGKAILRVREQERTLGPEGEWPPERAQREVQRIRDAIDAGTWQGFDPVVVKENPADLPTFHQAANAYLHRLRKKKRSDRTIELTEQVLAAHLIPFFGDVRMDRIDKALIESYTDAKTDDRDKWTRLRERYRENPKSVTADQAAAIRFGHRGLSPYSINRSVKLLASIYTRVQLAHPWVMPAVNPARDRDLRLSEDRINRTHLEVDQLAALFDAAQDVDENDRADRRSINRHALVATMALSGVRVGELVALRRRDVDLTTRTLSVGRAKTEAGVRVVQLTDYLAEVLRDHLDKPTRWDSKDDLLFPSSRGTPRETSRVGDRIVARCVERGEELLAERGQNPMPEGITNHSLRRTYVTLSLAYGEQPRWLMGQVGHRDSNLVMEIYGQFSQRRRKSDPRLNQWFAISD